jgi:hypothetical protein
MSDPERSAHSIHFGMIARERYMQAIGSQQTRAFAHDCPVPHAKSRPAKTYSIRVSERDAARLRRPPPRSDALSSSQRLSIEPNPSARIGNLFHERLSRLAAGAANRTISKQFFMQYGSDGAKLSLTKTISPKIQTTRMIIAGYINQTTSPNHALEPTTTAVTDRAPSSTLRASCGRGSS